MGGLVRPEREMGRIFRYKRGVDADNTPIDSSHQSKERFEDMKATGIVRRIDDLGRVVIPKEIRRTMRIREGDPLEIFTDREGGVIFRKYSLMGGLSEFAGEFCDTLNRTTGEVAVITDRDSCIAVAGNARRELQDKRISQELERLMEGRQIYRHQRGGERIPLCAEEGRHFVWTAAPILSEGDVLGCVLFTGSDESGVGDEADCKLVQSVAGFLGKHMES